MSYSNYKKLAQEFLQNTTDPKIKESAENLQSVLETEDGKQLAEDMTNQFQEPINRAIEAAQAGDMNGAKWEISKIMSTPKGASMISKILSLLQK